MKPFSGDEPGSLGLGYGSMRLIPALSLSKTNIFVLSAKKKYLIRRVGCCLRSFSHGGISESKIPASGSCVFKEYDEETFRVAELLVRKTLQRNGIHPS